VVGPKSLQGNDLIEIKMEPTMTAQQPEQESEPDSVFAGKLISFSGSGKNQIKMTVNKTSGPSKLK